MQHIPVEPSDRLDCHLRRLSRFLHLSVKPVRTTFQTDAALSVTSKS